MGQSSRLVSCVAKYHQPNTASTRGNKPSLCALCQGEAQPARLTVCDACELPLKATYCPTLATPLLVTLLTLGACGQPDRTCRRREERVRFCRGADRPF
ncbi:hypothetical protein ACOMHN_056628 [Nucella lapillus]